MGTLGTMHHKGCKVNPPSTVRSSPSAGLLGTELGKGKAQWGTMGNGSNGTQLQ